MAGPARLEFDPSEMLSYAATLANAGDELRTAATRLKGLGGSAGDLPPGVLGMVQAETGAAAAMVAGAASAYAAAGTAVRNAAAQARAAGEGGGWQAAADGGAKVIKHLGSMITLYDKDFSGTDVRRLDRAATAAKAMADLTGTKDLATLLKFDDYRKAYRDAAIAQGTSPLSRLRQTMREKVRAGLEQNIGGRQISGAPGAPPRPPLPADATGFRRFVRRGAGYVPLTGAGLDLYTLDSDKKALIKDRSIRNATAILASGAHVTADLAQVGMIGPWAPVTFVPSAAVAAGAEVTGAALDVGVLAIDLGTMAVDKVRDKVPFL